MSKEPQESKETIRADCFPKARNRMEMGPDTILNTKFLFHLVAVCLQDGPFTSEAWCANPENGAINARPLGFNQAAHGSWRNQTDCIGPASSLEYHWLVTTR